MEISKAQNAPEGVILVPTGELKPVHATFARFITLIAFLLIAIGLANLYSATKGGPMFYSQVKNLGLGVLLFVVFGWVIPPRNLNSYAYWFYAVVVFMLVLVDVMGTIAGGSQRWIRVGVFGGQPSELAKISVAIIVARFFHITRMASAYTLRDLAPLIILVGVIFALIFLQPDLGTAGLCLIIATIQVSFVRIDARSLGLVIGIAMFIMVAGWFIFLHDYQKLRILNLLNPDMDPLKSGYNSIQSLIAVGSGQFWGKGFMEGTQTQLQFLPARHTDFIFSVFAEEHGFMGATIVYLLFLAICYLGLSVARQSKTTFSTLLAIGMSGMIFVSFMINTSMVLGLFPVVGVPLPFFSHGGTALLTFCTALGILCGIDRDNNGMFRSVRPLKNNDVRKR